MTQQQYRSEQVYIGANATTTIVFVGNYISIKQATIHIDDVDVVASTVPVAFEEDGAFQNLPVGDGLQMAQGYDRVVLLNPHDDPVTYEVKLALGTYRDNRTVTEVERINSPVEIAGPMTMQTAIDNPIEMTAPALDVTGNKCATSIAIVSKNGTATIVTIPDDGVLTSFVGVMGHGGITSGGEAQVVTLGRSMSFWLEDEAGIPVYAIGAVSDQGAEAKLDQPIKIKSGYRIRVKSGDNLKDMRIACVASWRVTA